MDKTLERILELIPKKGTGEFEHGALKKFANSIGLKSGNLIADWTAGRSNSYKRYVHEIAAKYDVSVEWLKGETDEMGGTGQFQGDNPTGVPGAAAIAAIDTAGAALFAGKKKKPAPTNGGGLKAAQYDKLNPENRALVDQMIEKLLKSQSAE